MKYTRIPDSASTNLPSSATWRPWTIRTPFLVAFTTLCVLLCISIELTVRGCSKTGCHVFGTYSDRGLPRGTDFAYNQLPTVLGLVLSLLWALPHHDLMRLEPYFRMSVQGGEAALYSLFLEYPYTFPVFIPFKAAKRRHFVVLLSSSILLLMNFLIIPLISGIFEDGMLAKPIPGSATRAAIYEQGTYNLSAAFSYIAYDYAWLDGTLPSFIKPTYALLPVRNATGMVVGNETWTAETTRFWAELTCEDALVVFGNGSLNFNSPGGDGFLKKTYCGKDQFHENWCDRWTSFLTPWTSVTYEAKSSENGSATNLYGWAKGVDPESVFTNGTFPMYIPRNITAIFCTASYYSEPVRAKFTMPAGEVLEANQTGPRVQFTNLANFEGVISGDFEATVQNGSRDSSDELVAFGYQPQQLPSVGPQLVQRFGKYPEDLIPYESSRSQSSVYMNRVEALNGFALFNQSNDTLHELLDPKTLGKTLESALQLLFAVAVTKGMVDGHTAETVNVTRHVPTRGFVVNDRWARGTEGGLVVVVVLVVMLTLLVGRRRCELDGEPNSLAAALRLLSASPELSIAMENSEFYPPEEILKVLDNGSRRYKLNLVQGQGPRVQVIRGIEDAATHNDRLPAPSQDQVPWVERLWALRTVSGVGYLICFGIVTALLVAAFLQSRRDDGLPTIAPIGSFGYKVLFSYIPIAVGMAIEPALVTLGACHCMLGPYKALDRGRATSSVSLAVDYDRSPPHFQLVRSLRTGNIALAALTVAILLSNVLAVAFAGLFSAVNEGIQGSGPLKVQEGFTGSANGMYYVLAKSLESNDTRPPTWTKEGYYIVPFYPIGRDGQEEYTGGTLGISVDINCSLVPAESINLRCDNFWTNESGIINCPVAAVGNITNYLYIDDPCWKYTLMSGADDEYRMNDSYKWYNPSGDTLVRSANCDDRLFAVWVERPADPKPKDLTFPYQDHFEALALNCMSTDRFVNLTATIAKGGHVVSIGNIHPLDVHEVDALYPPKTGTDARLAATFLDSIDNGISRGNYHQIKWFNYLMATVKSEVVRSTPPNITHIPNQSVMSAFEDVYRRLFAINLRLHARTILSLDTVEGARIIQPRGKVYVSSTMFYIAAAILGFMIVVLVALYWGQDRQVVGHLPRNLVGMYAHLYASNAKEECAQVIGTNPEDRAMKLGELKGRYAYGRFSNGKNVGVYRKEAYTKKVVGELKYREDVSDRSSGEEDN